AADIAWSGDLRYRRRVIRRRRDAARKSNVVDLILSSYHAGVEIQTLDGRSCIPGRPASAVAIRQQIDCYRLIPAAIDLLEHRRAIITRQRRLPDALRKAGPCTGHADGKITILA